MLLLGYLRDSRKRQSRTGHSSQLVKCHGEAALQLIVQIATKGMFACPRCAVRDSILHSSGQPGTA